MLHARQSMLWLAGISGQVLLEGREDVYNMFKTLEPHSVLHDVHTLQRQEASRDCEDGILT